MRSSEFLQLAAELTELRKELRRAVNLAEESRRFSLSLIEVCQPTTEQIIEAAKRVVQEHPTTAAGEG